MFTDFTAIDRWTKKQVHCLYQALIVAIATRHADSDRVSHGCPTDCHSQRNANADALPLRNANGDTSHSLI